jgi:hypothetical protein
MVLSLEPEASIDPSEEKATESKRRVSVRSSFPVLISQNLIVLSNEPEASIDPSEEKATELTENEWPMSVQLFAGLNIPELDGVVP